MKEKIIKDSIHGYIEIENDFIPIINSPEFQRLKYIEQGSYRVLYPSARHDRFIHSLGVYHLSRLFGTCFLENIKNDLQLTDNYTIQEKTFHYASLMHDVGHAPFSHTTEVFFEYASVDENSKISFDLKEQVKQYISSLNLGQKKQEKRIEAFNNDYDTMQGKPKPHEIVSATLLIELANKYLNQSIVKQLDLELAARMVIGCSYFSNKDEKDNNLLGIQNGLIRLLNSDTVDVDKLDYITRDNMMTGFDNVSIDINRLAKSVTAIKKEDSIFPAFNKNSLSVIDNVFRAKEEQGNWIISHPVVLYDSKILSNAIAKLWDEDTLEKIFSIESLSKDGNIINEQKYLLLNDNDIMFELKKKVNFTNDNLYAQIFDRNIRYKPLWKSKDEYKILFGDKKKSIFALFKGLINYFEDKDFLLNDETLNNLIKEGKKDKSFKEIINTANFLKTFFNDNQLEFGVAFTTPKSSFAPSFVPSKVYIRFDQIANDSQKYITYQDLGRTWKTDKFEYFYIYSKTKFSSKLLSKFVQKCIQKVTEKERV